MARDKKDLGWAAVQTVEGVGSAARQAGFSIFRRVGSVVDTNGAGIHHRFDQIALGSNLADSGQIGADVAAQVTDGVTGGARGFDAIEDGLAAADISFSTRANQFGRRIMAQALPADEFAFEKWNADPFVPDGGSDGRTEDDEASYLLPYWMGRYHGLLAEAP